MDEYRYAPMPESTQPAQPKAAPKRFAVEKGEPLFVLLSFVVGFAFCELILFGGFAVAVPVFFFIFYAVVLAYLGRGRKILTREAALSFLPVAVLLLCFLLYDNMTLRALNVFALWGAAAFNLQVLSGRPVFWFGEFVDMLQTTFYMPLHNIDKSVKVLGSMRQIKKIRTVLMVAGAVLVISPILIVVVSLLMSSDAGFADAVNSVLRFITKQVWQYFFKVVLGVLLAFPVYSLLYSLRHDPHARKHPLEGALLRLGGLETVVTVAALALFIVLYVLYIAMQANYLFSALHGTLPTAFTYAGYAKRGFFELVGVSVINFCLIAGAIAFTKRKAGEITRGCRISVTLIALLTLLLLVTAASKMVLYMHTYGLTPLRVYTSWFMLLLGVILVFIIIKMGRKRFAFCRAAAVTAVAMYLVLNLANVDGIIASYNIRLYQSNPVRPLDVTLFYGLSDSAFPALAPLSDDPQCGKEVRLVLQDRQKQITATGWKNYSVAKSVALSAIEKSN